MNKFELLNAELGLFGEDLEVYHYMIKSYDDRCNRIGAQLDGKNFLDTNFLVFVSIYGDRTYSMALNYVTNDGDIREIETLENDSLLAKAILKDIKARWEKAEQNQNFI